MRSGLSLREGILLRETLAATTNRCIMARRHCCTRPGASLQSPIRRCSATISTNYFLHAPAVGPACPSLVRQRPFRLVCALAFLTVFCCHEYPWSSSGVWPSEEAFHGSAFFWGALASSTFDSPFLGRQINTDALKHPAPSVSPERPSNMEDDFLDDEEPLEIWGDLDDRL